MAESTDQILAKLAGRAQIAFGADLICVVLYGSAAEVGEHDPAFSDVNVACVLRSVGPHQLASARQFFGWCGMYGIATPLLLAEQEIAPAAASFPIEFRDMERRRRVLFGPDLFTGVRIDESAYRTQIEYELRSKLIRLRQRAASIFDDPKLLRRLLLDSITTFCVLIRHALVLKGVSEDGLDRRAALAVAEREFGMRAATLVQLLEARQNKQQRRALRARDVLGDYLQQVETVTRAVGELARPAAGGTGGTS